jgi:hypothetical protein
MVITALWRQYDYSESQEKERERERGKYQNGEPTRPLSQVTHVSGFEVRWREVGAPVLPRQCRRLEIDGPELFALTGGASACTFGGPHHRGGILPRVLILVFLAVRDFTYVSGWLQ